MSVRLFVYRFLIGACSLVLFVLFLHLPFRLYVNESSVLTLIIVSICGGIINILLVAKNAKPEWELSTSIVLEAVPAILGTLIVTLVVNFVPKALAPMLCLSVFICLWFAALLETRSSKSRT